MDAGALVSILLSLIMVMAIFVPFGFMYFLDWIRKTKGFSRVIVLEKDGTYTVKWMKLKSNKKFNLGGKERLVDPKGRFIGKLGNLFVYLGDSVKPITVESTEVKSEIDVDDVSNMVTLAFQAGKQAGLKNTDRIQQIYMLTLATLVVAGITLILMIVFQMQGQLRDGINHILQALKTVKAP